MATIKLFYGTDDKLYIKDTNVHSYRTKEVAMIYLLNTIPSVINTGVYIYNNTNVDITATPVLNVFQDGTLPDIELASTTISPYSPAIIPIPQDDLFMNFYSVNFKASAVPNGYLQAFAIINYNYTTK